MAQKLTRAQGCWIKYQLDLNKITQEAVSDMSDCSSTMVSQYLKGRKASEPVEIALMKLLGYNSMQQLLSGCREHLGGVA